MKLSTTYKGTLNGKRGLWCGFKPEDLSVEEEMHILLPEEGKQLKRKSDGEVLDSIQLKGEDIMENYEEIDRPSEEKEIEFRP